MICGRLMFPVTGPLFGGTGMFCDCVLGTTLTITGVVGLLPLSGVPLLLLEQAPNAPKANNANKPRPAVASSQPQVASHTIVGRIFITSSPLGGPWQRRASPSRNAAKRT